MTHLWRPAIKLLPPNHKYYDPRGNAVVLAYGGIQFDGIVVPAIAYNAKSTADGKGRAKATVDPNTFPPDLGFRTPNIILLQCMARVFLRVSKGKCPLCFLKDAPCSTCSSVQQAYGRGAVSPAELVNLLKRLRKVLTIGEAETRHPLGMQIRRQLPFSTAIKAKKSMGLDAASMKIPHALLTLAPKDQAILPGHVITAISAKGVQNDCYRNGQVIKGEKRPTALHEVQIADDPTKEKWRFITRPLEPEDIAMTDREWQAMVEWLLKSDGEIAEGAPMTVVVTKEVGDVRWEGSVPQTWTLAQVLARVLDEAVPGRPDCHIKGWGYSHWLELEGSNNRLPTDWTIEAARSDGTGRGYTNAVGPPLLLRLGVIPPPPSKGDDEKLPVQYIEDDDLDF